MRVALVSLLVVAIFGLGANGAWFGQTKEDAADDSIVSRLATGELSVARVGELLADLNPKRKLRTFTLYSAEDYVNLAHRQPSACLGGAYKSNEAICKATDLANLKKYCQHHLSELLDYCKQHTEEVVLELRSRIEPLVESANTFKANYEEHVGPAGLDAADYSKNVRAVCLKMAQKLNYTPLRDVKSIARLMDENSLEHLGLDEARVLRQMGSAGQTSYTALVELSKAVAQNCISSSYFY